MAAKWTDEEWKKFVLERWSEWHPEAQIKCQTGAPEPPSDRGEYLDYLNEWAESIEWPSSEAPTVEREDKDFLLCRRSTREDTHRRNIYTALGTVLKEELLKSEE